MTMPAPPPNGLSSTVRCRSWAKSRRSCTRTSRMPSRRALPMSDRSRGARYSGKIETTSTRTEVTPRGRAAPAGRRRRPGPPRGRPRARSRRRTGTWASRPSGSRMTSRSWAAPSSSPPTDPSRVPAGSTTASPRSCSSVKTSSSSASRRQHVGGVDDQARAAQRLGAGAVGDLLERHEPDAVVHPGRAHGQHPRHPGARAGLGVDRRTDGEAALGLVGVQLHGHLTVQAVRLADAGDEDGGVGGHAPDPLRWTPPVRTGGRGRTRRSRGAPPR